MKPIVIMISHSQENKQAERGTRKQDLDESLHMSMRSKSISKKEGRKSLAIEEGILNTRLRGGGRASSAAAPCASLVAVGRAPSASSGRLTSGRAQLSRHLPTATASPACFACGRGLRPTQSPSSDGHSEPRAPRRWLQLA